MDLSYPDNAGPLPDWGLSECPNLQLMQPNSQAGTPGYEVQHAYCQYFSDRRSIPESGRSTHNSLNRHVLPAQPSQSVCPVDETFRVDGSLDLHTYGLDSSYSEVLVGLSPNYSSVAQFQTFENTAATNLSEPDSEMIREIQSQNFNGSAQSSQQFPTTYTPPTINVPKRKQELTQAQRAICNLYIEHFNLAPKRIEALIVAIDAEESAVWDLINAHIPRKPPLEGPSLRRPNTTQNRRQLANNPLSAQTSRPKTTPTPKRKRIFRPTDQLGPNHPPQTPRAARHRCQVTDDKSKLRRDNSQPLQCTRKCGKKFSTYKNWQRHEKESAQSKSSLCMVGYLDLHENKCTVCSLTDPSADHVSAHEPNFSSTELCGQAFQRRDHLAIHLKNQHNIQKNTAEYQTYKKRAALEVNCAFTKCCGFCGKELTHQKDRFKHIRFAFEKRGKSMMDWSDDMALGHVSLKPSVSCESVAGVSALPADQSGNGSEDDSSGSDANSSSDFDDAGSSDRQDPAHSHQENGRGRSKRTRPGESHSNQQERQQQASKPYHQYAAPTVSGAKPSALDGKQSYCPFLGPDTFKIIRRLGQGAFSRVEEVFHFATNVRLARKTARGNGRLGLDHLIREASVLKKLRHPHIVQLIGTLTEFPTPTIFLAPVAQATLAEYLDSAIVGDKLVTSRLRRWFGCLASAILHIHGSSYSHGDLKPANILLTKEPEPNLLLCDFGASHWEGGQGIADLKHRVFTKRYRAPEMTKALVRGPRADIFSLGCVFIEMSAVLFSKTTEELSNFRKAFPMDRAYHQELELVSQWIHRLQCHAPDQDFFIFKSMLQMFDIHPEQRPIASELASQFLPGDCCLAWPSAQPVQKSPFQILHALATVKNVLQNGNFAHDSLPSTSQVFHDMSSLSPKRRRDKHDLDYDFLQLAWQRYKRPDKFALQLATQWLSECSSSHATCCENSMGKFFPSRLVDLGHPDSPSPALRLISHTNLSHKVLRYVALSHTWGPNLQGKMFTTIHNFNALSHEIPIQSLPDTVVDAIAVTRGLGLRYLWVDTLCIIQDSKDDCSKFSEMGDIYKNSFVTLILTSVQSPPFGGGSLAGSRNLLAVEEASKLSPQIVSNKMHTPGSAKNLGAASLYGEEPFDLSKDCGYYQDPTASCWATPKAVGHIEVLGQKGHALTALGARSAHLNPPAYWTRAWSLQEVMLSPRVIYVTEIEVWFECRSLKASETFPQGLPPLLWESVHGLWTDMRSNHLSDARDHEHCDLWSCLVEAYSQHNQAINDSKLSAISCLAMAMKTVLKDEYIQGMWAQSLSWTLLWQPRASGHPSRRLHQSPSWSWASVDSAIEIPRYSIGTPLAHTTCWSPDETDLSCKTLLRMHGRMSIARTVYTDKMEDYHRVQIPLRLKGAQVDGLAYLDDPAVLCSTQYSTIWLRSSSSSIGGLLLSQDSEKKVYRRIGVCFAALPGKGQGEGLSWALEDLDCEYVEVDIC